MRSSTRLDSASFQLTPTRTRCDLVVSAKGKTEKIASGLLNPFLAHLKTAQEQLAKGGYTIILEPGPSSNATWFTRGTVERFVRFVSTPEILERVYTVESEILQIEEAIAIQGHNEAEMLGENQMKPVERVEGSRFVLDTSEEKAIVLYQPGVNSSEANGFTTTDENSKYISNKFKLVKVLEARKSVLQKEQGMDFARAVAAGFHVDDMPSLMSFAECFGAVRLMDGCRKYTDLWKKKHETGQWFEIDSTDAIPSKSDFSHMNASGIQFTDKGNMQKEYEDAWVESHNGTCTDGSRKASSNMGADEKLCMMNQQPTGHQEYFQGQYPPHMCPPWPIHSPQSSLPVFQPYLVPGMPYYQNYAGSIPFSHPSNMIAGQGKHSLGRKGINVDSETGDVDSPNVRAEDDLDNSDRELQKKGSKSSKKKPGKVVIKNINYISSREHDSGGEESETDEEDGDSEINNSRTNRKNSMESSRTERSSEKLSNRSGKSDKEANILGKEANGHWQAFENFLLRDANEHSIDNGMYANENEGRMRQKKVGDLQSTNDKSVILKKGNLYNNGGSVNGLVDVQHSELEGRRSSYKQTGNTDFIINDQKNIVTSSSDPLIINEFDHRPNNLNRQSTNSINDSYIVSMKSSSLNQVENGGGDVIDVDSEFPSAALDSKNIFNKVASQLKYAPNELNMMPERRTEKRSIGYNHAIRYEMQIQVGKNLKKESIMPDSKKDSKKLERDRKSKLVVDVTDKRKAGGPIRRGKPSKLSPLDEARVRAEKLRTYKADLQKMKKEKEDEEIKRLEALKIQRQKRISARGSFTSPQPSIPRQQTKKHIPTKLAPNSIKGSKFTDSEPVSLSPLQRVTKKITPIGSIASKKAYNPSRANKESALPGHRLSRSVSSLSEPKKENGNKVMMARMRRLSEPKTSNNNNVSSVKQKISEPWSKQRKINGFEKKKISAIVNHDRSKVATLPELKIRTSRKPEITLSGPVVKEKARHVSSLTSDGVHIESRNGISLHSEADDNPMIDKTVLMLECGPGKPVDMKGNVLDESLQMSADIEGIVHPSPDLPFSYEVTLSNGEKETPKFSTARAVEKPYNAPYARVSSSNDPSTCRSDYGKSPPTSLEFMVPSSGSKAQVSSFGDSKQGKILEAIEKPEIKESFKGFKKLMKFGRKSYSPNEVQSLESLISEEETTTASTSQKSSRSFSLLSPFRSKHKQKKLMV